MARRDSAPRRYAEAAFEIALRDGTVEEWRSELDLAAAELDSAELNEALANPALPL
jgi:F0F1-type ATP synthase delta subunit